MMSDKRRARGRAEPVPGFVFYVEGPRDRDILGSWARRLAPSIRSSLDRCTVILGGRQPARAADHFARRCAGTPGLRGLCVLDRDGHAPRAEESGGEAAVDGLEFFTWPRRQIESYLLVPEALQRTAPRSADRARVGRVFADHVPSGERELASVHAKRLLQAGGPLALDLGWAPQPSKIARSMRTHEIHADVCQLVQRVRTALDPGPPPVTVVVRRAG